jgi:hypothetical protein
MVVRREKKVDFLWIFFALCANLDFYTCEANLAGNERWSSFSRELKIKILKIA